MIKLAIFDLDGVLTSTTDEHFNAWRAIFKNHFAIDIDPLLEQKTKGVSRIDSLNALLDHYKIGLDQNVKLRLAYEKNRLYQESVMAFDSSKLLTGVTDILDFLKSKNVKIALGSASQNGPVLLDKLGIAEKFDYIVNPAHLLGKPNPDIFLDAMRHFDCTPDQCIGFEDAISGIEAIKRAGMFAVGIGPENLAKADIHVKTFPELDKSLLEQIIQGDL